MRIEFTTALNLSIEEWFSDERSVSDKVSGKVSDKVSDKRSGAGDPQTLETKQVCMGLGFS